MSTRRFGFRPALALAQRALYMMDSNMSDPDLDVIEKRLHSLLVLSALLMTASISLFDLPSEKELSLQSFDVDEVLEMFSNVSTNPNFWMGCKLLGWLCSFQSRSQKYRDGDVDWKGRNPVEELRDDFVHWTGMATHLSFLGLVLTMLCYLSLNHLHLSSKSLKFWYRSNAICIFSGYIITASSAVCMCFAFNGLALLKGGFDVYLETVQRTYTFGYCLIAVSIYLVITLIVSNSIQGGKPVRERSRSASVLDISSFYSSPNVLEKKSLTRKTLPLQTSAQLQSRHFSDGKPMELIKEVPTNSSTPKRARDTTFADLNISVEDLIDT